MFRIYILSFLFVGNLHAAVPNMFQVDIGKPYPIDPAIADSDTPKSPPVTQFYAPNSGKTSDVFPEYQVVVLKETKNVMMLVGKRSYSTINKCESDREIMKSLTAEKFKQLKYSETGNEFNNDNENIFVGLNCIFVGGNPFAVLEYRIRGKKENELMKNAWDNRFK